ncbi:MAG: homogentisate 1,2-dioxygenase, partial [Sphingobacteriales bacterium]
VNTVSYDHSDPSIFTVLTCPSAIPGERFCPFLLPYKNSRKGIIVSSASTRWALSTLG